MMKNSIQSISCLLLVAVIFFSSCKKKAEVDADTQSSVDHSIAEESYSKIYPTTQAIAVEEEGVKRTVRKEGEGTNKKESATGKVTCATINILTDTVGPDDFPFTFEIDYGSGCVDPHDGRMRKGKLKATFSGYWDVEGSSLTIELIDYYENGVNLQGTVIAKKGTGSYTTSVIDGRCVTSNWEIEYSNKYTYKWLSGQNTDSTNTDDVIEMTGEAEGVNREGKSYIATITQPLVKDMSCKWIQEGVLDLTPEDLSTRTLDFGNGSCDNKATVTINGNTVEFEMQ